MFALLPVLELFSWSLAATHSSTPASSDRLFKGSAGQCRIIHAMREYRGDAEWEVARWEHNYARLPPRHRRAYSRPFDADLTSRTHTPCRPLRTDSQQEALALNLPV